MDHDCLLDPSDSSPDVRRRLADWLRLRRAFGPGPREALQAFRELGSPRRALEERVDAWPDVAADLRSLGRCGARVWPIDAPDFPARLGQLSDAPPLLFARGHVGALAASRPVVAIVGARAASAYGLSVARRLASALAERGVTIVSGLARGIDGAAHRAALESGGETVGVLACGPDEIYPPEHADLAWEIERSGALLTEFPPGTPPLPYFFPLRNRIISALSQVVVVVEAREQSGSLHTARHALEQGVEVMAVPGPVDRAGHRGSNRLLRDGAAPVLGVEDVLDRLAPSVRAASPRRAPGPPLSAPARQLVGVLESGSETRDRLAESLGWPPGELAAALQELEMHGRAQLERDGRWRAVDPEPSGD
ncbi:MAG: DNA-processing protein DprA [Myxococcota bacterium]